MSALSAGAQFRAACARSKPLAVVGTINAYTARMAKAVGHQAIYLSGGGLAANSTTHKEGSSVMMSAPTPNGDATAPPVLSGIRHILMKVGWQTMPSRA